MLLGVPLIWMSVWAAEGRILIRTPLDFPVVVLLGMVLVSLLVTFDPFYSLPKVTGVLLGTLMYYAAVRRLRSPMHAARGLVAFLLAGGVLAVVGLLGTEWAEKIRPLTSVAGQLPVVIRGIPGAEAGFHPNAVAGSLLFFIPLQLSVLAGRFRGIYGPDCGGRVLAPGRAGLIMQLVLLALSGVMFLLSQSRGAWLAMAGAGAVWFAIRVWRRGRTFGVIMSVMILTPGIVIAYSGAMAYARWGLPVPGRVELWVRALEGIQDFPLTGMGMNAFRRVTQVLYPLFLVPPGFDVTHAHNQWLQAALDLGVPGLIGYAALWIVAAWLLLRVMTITNATWIALAARGLALGLVAHFIFGLADAISLGAKLGLVFWMSLALIVSLHQIAFNDSGAIDGNSPLRPHAATAI